MSDSGENKPARGFLRRLVAGPTIADLATALALITVATAVAIPCFYSQPRITLDHAAILLANDLRYAQNEAAVCGEATRIVFNDRGDGYTVAYTNGDALPNPVGGGDLKRRYSFDAIFRGVRLNDIHDINSVRFDRSGFALSSLEVELSYEGEKRLLKMTKGTGLVSIEGLDSAWTDDGL